MPNFHMNRYATTHEASAAIAAVRNGTFKFKCRDGISRTSADILGSPVFAMAAPGSPPAPPPPPPAAALPLTYRGKTYGQLSNVERAELHTENSDLFTLMRAVFIGNEPGGKQPTAETPLQCKGKTYAQMNNIERAELRKSDRSLFTQMRDQAYRTRAI